MARRTSSRRSSLMDTSRVMVELADRPWPSGGTPAVRVPILRRRRAARRPDGPSGRWHHRAVDDHPRRTPVDPDRYGPDVLGRPAARARSTPTPAEHGLVVEDVTTGWVGAVTRVEVSGGLRVVVLEDRHGRTRTFPLGPGFWVDGQPVDLVAPTGPAAPV